MVRKYAQIFLWPEPGDDAAPMRGRRQMCGFTLVEILCVVFILGIASAIIVPQIGSNDDLNAAAGARVVMADLLYAQNRAISTQTWHYVQFNVSTQSYTIYNIVGSTLTALTHPVTQQPYVVNFGAAGTGSLANCSLTSANFGGQSMIAFDESGVPYSYNLSTGTATALIGAGAIVIAAGSNSLTISVAQDTGDVTCN